jgi:hypothetical protein
VNITSSSDFANLAMPKIAQLNVSDLFVDPAYQRDVVHQQANYLAERWNTALAGGVRVSKRADGRYAIIDGQQRVMAIALRGRPTRIRCEVFTDLTLAEEAGLFVVFNRVPRKITSLQQFKAEILANDPEALDVKRIVESFSLEIAEPRGVHTRIGAVSTLLRIYRTPRFGREVLQKALAFNDRYFRNMEDSNNTHWLMGMAYIVTKYDVDDLTTEARERLDDLWPHEIHRRAQQEVETFGGSSAGDSVGLAIARIIGGYKVAGGRKRSKEIVNANVKAVERFKKLKTDDKPKSTRIRTTDTYNKDDVARVRRNLELTSPDLVPVFDEVVNA